MDLRTEAVETMCRDFPEAAPAGPALIDAAGAIVGSLSNGGTLYLCGNGGSFADSLHIAGELKKSFERPRPLPDSLRKQLLTYPSGEELAAHLHAGLRVAVLGVDPVLATAVDNDIGLAHVTFAQELVALGRSGDVLLGISTSGSATNVLYAASVAKALGMSVLALTGESDSALVEIADVSVRAPARGTATVQGWHSQIYHALCRVIEDSMFPDDRVFPEG